VLDRWLDAPSRIEALAAIADEGHQVTCIFPAETLQSFRNRNLSVETVRIRRQIPIVSYLRFGLVAVTRLLTRYRHVDVVVLAPDVFPLSAPLLLRRVLGIEDRPLLAIREASPPVETHSIRRYYRLILRDISLQLLSAFCDVIFAISPMHAFEVSSNFKIPPEKVQVWPSTFDPQLFDPRKYTWVREKIRRELRIDDKVLLLHHGSLSSERGLFELVRALRQVRETRRDVLLCLLGKGPAEQELRRLVRFSDLDDAVIFHPPVVHAEVPHFIAAADIGVVPLPDQPQWRYQTPTKLLEYLAMGKPVVITDIIAHRWIAQDYSSAFFCGQGQPTEISNATLKCLRTQNFTGEASPHKGLNQFSSLTVAKSLIKSFDELMKRQNERRASEHDGKECSPKPC
jgi:glycosyltransferase involved in cell wall biosynthesis